MRRPSPPLILLLFSVLWVGTMSSSTAQPSRGPVDTLSTPESDFLLSSDSLSVRFIGKDEAVEPPSTQGYEASLQFGWSLAPLRHFGPNVFQPVTDNPFLKATIRQLKGDAHWEPLTPGLFLSNAYNYHYGTDGANKRSSFGQFRFERPLRREDRWGFRLVSRYDGQVGPFPNQQTTRLDGLLTIFYRLTPQFTVQLGVLGKDNGWYLNKGNQVYTDRARYMLEQLNTWRSRSRGVEIQSTKKWTGGAELTLFGRYISQDWASDPPDPSRLLIPANGDTLPDVPSSVLLESQRFLNGVYPVVSTVVQAAERRFRSFEAGGDLSLALSSWNNLTIGLSAGLDQLSHLNHWQTLTLVDRYQAEISPKQFSVHFSDRIRWWKAVMATGLRYEYYDPGTTQWTQLYQTYTDDRVGSEALQPFLLASGGGIAPFHLLNPRFGLTLPLENYSAHLLFSIVSRTYTLEDRYRAITATPYTDRSVTSLQPGRTWTLESGIQLARRSVTLDLTAFYRDTERYLPLFGPDVLPQTVSSYASTWGRVDRGLQRQKGFELSLFRPSVQLRRGALRVSGRLSYLHLFDTAKPIRRDLPVTPTEPITPSNLTAFDTRLNAFWNRKHLIALFGTMRFRSGLTLTGMAHVQSGVPYRPLNPSFAGQVVPRDQAEPVAHGPWMRRIDGRIDFPLLFGRRRSGIVLFVEGRNLTNEESVDAVTDPAGFAQSHIPDNATISQPQRAYGTARSFWLGLEIKW